MNYFSSRARLRAARLVVAPVLSLIAACAAPSDDGKSDNGALVSDRAQTFTHQTVIVKLSLPPLLTKLRTTSGKPVIDPADKAALLAEQQKFLDSLRSLPGQIDVLYTYRLTLNGFALSIPIELEDKFRSLPGVLDIDEEQTFPQPVPLGESNGKTEDVTTANSVSFIGGRAAKELGLSGAGIRVGVIDTGVDYTHAMFGGAGTPDAYSSNDPATVEPGSFPTEKVIGGIDLVGSKYDASSFDESAHIPHPDGDPLDEAGHGSHVAGTIAGHGDDIHTYTGVAPDARLYAIKIFGKDGSTGTGAILAAFEYAADPNQDLDVSDRLDVVNLSLGSDWGTRYSLYDSSIANLAAVGTVTVCAGGNAGPTPYIVGSPGSAERAISVAATIDDSPWNWKFPAVRFVHPGNGDDLQRIYDAAFSKPAVEAQGVGGKLVYIGLAAAPLDADEKAALAGNVALIDRGEVAFQDKVSVAFDGGAIGVVMVNNNPDEPFTMGGGDPPKTFPIPAVMITQAVGTTLKNEIAAGQTATVTFSTGRTVDQPEYIDSLTDFSSRGPRSLDGLIKPELTAPGQGIISAKMGGGFEGVKMNGTSMASPHVAGAMALLRQAHPDADVAELKSRVMNTGAPVHDASGPAGVAAQGAGRLRIVEATQTALVLDPPSVSLGIIAASAPQSISRVIQVKNTSDAAVKATLSFTPKPGLTISAPSTLDVPAHATRSVTIGFKVDLGDSAEPVTELDNLIHISSGIGAAAQTLVLPVLAEGTRGSKIDLAEFTRTKDGPFTLALSNKGPLSGEAIPFNLLGQQNASTQESACALASAGYRIVKTTDEKTNESRSMLEFGVRLAQPLSTWIHCDVSVLFDTNNDGVPEQELAGTSDSSLWPEAPADPFGSFLVDAPKMRELRAQAERDTTAGKEVTASGASAVLDIQPFAYFDHSPIAIVAADMSKIAKTPNGMIRFKVGTLGATRDDFIGHSAWYLVDPNKIAFRDLPASLPVASGGAALLSATSYDRKDSLLVYLPQNDRSIGTALLIPPSGAPTFAP
jgi:subtilisin family serine protease